MKKILSFALAICLVLSLSLVAFAESSKSPSPQPDDSAIPSIPGAADKYAFSVTTASGLRLNATVETVTSGDVYNEIANNGVVGLYYVNIASVVSDNEIVNVDVYAPGVTADSTVIVRDAWEVLPGVTFTPNGNRATISAPAGVLNQYHYIALVNSWNLVDVNNPQQGTDNEEETENIDDTETPEVDVTETDTETAPVTDENPGTGVALAVVPMIIAAAAAAVVSKRR